jgi:hypothetical protein
MQSKEFSTKGDDSGGVEVYYVLCVLGKIGLGWV